MTKHDYHWTFGDKVHISFPGGGAPVNEPNHPFSSNEGCATYSDAGGNILFFTDGTLLYNPANLPLNLPPQPPLGGNSSSAHSAIIVPPAGGGSLYHVFAVADSANIGPVSYTPVAVAGSTVSLPVATVALPFGPQRAAEKLAAIPHKDCNKYWVVSLNVAPGPVPNLGAGTIYAMLIDSDAGPSAGPKTVSQPYPYPVAALGFCMKFSPDGTLLAVTSSPNSIDILSFNRSTGAFTAYSQIDKFPPIDAPYGVEFSPNGKYLYFSGFQSGYVNRYTIPSLPSPPTPFSGTQQVGLWPTAGALGLYKAGALQLAPNGKIYGTKVSQNTLFEIGLPDSPTATQLGVAFLAVATQAGGGPLTLNGTALLGLPTFTRIANDCLGDRCAKLADEVNEQIAQIPKVNTLRPCDKSQPIEKPPCAPLDLPKIAPWTSIKWGDSQCDCIEGDDTEVMHLTVCNPYSNLTLSNLTIHQLLVVDANGNPPPLLPDGSPSVQLVPIGPYCFDDLAPCTCVTREFVLRLRGAVPGPYHILVKGICFDACFHGDEEDCFIFNVCKD
jgi:hypothetical protein